MEDFTDPLVQRRRHLEQLKELGHELYPRKYDYSHTLTEVRALYDGSSADQLEAEKPEIRVCGRIMAVRLHGKAGFMDLFDGENRLQVYVKRDAVEAGAFDLFRIFDLGDIVAAEGTVFRTRTGELTVAAIRLRHLSKNLLPLPEKWHGLSDVETRFRQRYVDLLVNPDVRRVFVRRARIIGAIRKFLDARGYLEVETPVLQSLAGGATARPFATHHNALDLDLFLRIALELHLKRLIIAGIPRVYELSRIFRNEGISSQHNPEFTMLEFYQAYSDYHDLMTLTEEMLREVALEVAGSLQIPYQGDTIDFSRWRRLRLREAIFEFWPDGLARPSESDLRSVEALRKMLRELGKDFGEGDGAGKLQGALFEAVAEPHLVQPTFIYDYPTELSPLSKTKPDDPDTVERFELYIAGMEIANAYSELNDPVEQRERFREQLRARERGDEEAHAMDRDYLRALSYGMPPTAGEGIGIDRLAMVLTDSRSIRDVILFPLLRPEPAGEFEILDTVLGHAPSGGAS